MNLIEQSLEARQNFLISQEIEFPVMDSNAKKGCGHTLNELLPEEPFFLAEHVKVYTNHQDFFTETLTTEIEPSYSCLCRIDRVFDPETAEWVVAPGDGWVPAISYDNGKVGTNYELHPDARLFTGWLEGQLSVLIEGMFGEGTFMIFQECEEV